MKTDVFWAPLLLTLCFLMACAGGGKQEEDYPVYQWPTIGEDVLVNRFASFLQEETQDTLGINALIDHIIAKRWDLERHQSGCFYHIITPGNNDHPSWGDRLSVHYNAYQLDGTLFDSTYRRSKPFDFYLGNTISGWNECLPLLGVGGRALLVIPAHLAYGSQGFGQMVGPDEHLLFEVELLSLDPTQ